MKNRKALTIGAIALSILVVLLDAALYFRMVSFLNTPSQDSYERMGLLLSGIFLFGALAYGIGLLLIVWVEYFLILGIIKLCQPPRGVGKYVAIALLSLIAAVLLVVFVSVFVSLVTLFLK